MAMADTTKNVFVLDQYKNTKLKPDILAFTFFPKINYIYLNSYIKQIFLCGALFWVDVLGYIRLLAILNSYSMIIQFPQIWGTKGIRQTGLI